MLERKAVNKEKGIEVSFQMWNDNDFEEYGSVIKLEMQAGGGYSGTEFIDVETEEEGVGIIEDWTTGHGWITKIDKRW